MWKKRFVYLDNAATTRVCDSAYQAMQPYLRMNYANPSAGYEFGNMANQVLEYGRNQLADILDGKPEEIYYTSGGTESDNWALTGVALANAGKGNHIITSAIEHPAVMNTCVNLERYGFKISYIDVSKEGIINIEQLKRNICRETILISVMMANNEIGTIEPIAEIGRIAHRYGILLHTDAVQAFGHIPIDVGEQEIDLLSVSSHKFGGPKGVGFLYVRNGVAIMPYMHGGHQEQGLRAGTGNVSGIAGMTAAARNAWENMEKISRYERWMRDYMEHRLLKEIPSVTVNGKCKNRLPGNLNICIDGADGGTLQAMLDMKGICVSTGSACSSGSGEPSVVLKAIGLSDEKAYNSIRISISYHNTREEIDYAIEQIKQCVKELRMKSV